MVELLLPDFPSNYLSHASRELEKNGLTSSVPLIFADCFGAVTSKSPSLPNFAKLLNNLPELTQSALSEAYNRVFGIISGLFKSLPSSEDFKLVLTGMNIGKELQEGCMKSFTEFVEIVKTRRKGWEGTLKLPDKKRFQVSEATTEEYLGVRFAELVNVEWVGSQEICNTHLSRVGEAKYTIRMYILTNDFDLSVHSIKPINHAFHDLKIKAIEFICNYPELQNLLYQVSEGLHEAEMFSIPQ